MLALNSVPLVSLIALFAASTATSQDKPSPDPLELERFEREIRPLFVRRCTTCHGADQKKSGLRLDLVSGIRKGGRRGALFVPGRPDESLLIQAVRRSHDELRMPPRQALGAAEVERLETWVRNGAALPADDAQAAQADWQRRGRHWAWQAPEAREPELLRPSKWPRNFADRFVLAKLQSEGIEPAREAESSALVRRLYVDLIGLPPSAAEQRAFAADEAPGAYERLVDRLLASPHFGERWGRHWLDVMRYCESRGHEYDFRQPNAWRYRDYVVRAFNRDVPIDQFFVEHVAGDLLPKPRLDPKSGANESVLATASWFFTEEVHSPVDPRVEELDRLDNKVDVFSKAFLGLTVACARCHDHKFDAIKANDYYALSGWLLSADYRQVRFETEEHNRRIAQSLAAIEAQAENSVRGGLAEVLDERVDALSRAMAWAAKHAPKLAKRRSARARAHAPARLPNDFDLVFEDFDAADYGAWKVEGAAFDRRPSYASELPKRLRDRKPGVHGRGYAMSHLWRGERKSKQADKATGRLTSPPFDISRRYLHAMLAGGKRCRLEVIVDGRVVGHLAGRDHTSLRHAVLDLDAWRGRRARLVVRDDVAGGWGHIAVDRIVFSDSKDRDALMGALPIPVARHMATLIPTQDPRDRRLYAVALQSMAKGRGSLVELWQSLAKAAPAPQQTAPTGKLVADFAKTDHFVANGLGFGVGPRSRAQLVFDHDLWPVAVARHAGAATDPVFERLRLARGNESKPGKVDWVQAGRTLRTPSIRLEEPSLWYLVRGHGDALAVIDGHRMIHGPLHQRAVNRMRGRKRLRWVQHRLDTYVGRRIYVEFSPTREHDLEVLRVVQAKVAPSLAYAGESSLEDLAFAGGGSKRGAASAQDEVPVFPTSVEPRPRRGDSARQTADDSLSELTRRKDEYAARLHRALARFASGDSQRSSTRKAGVMTRAPQSGPANAADLRLVDALLRSRQWLGCRTPNALRELQRRRAPLLAKLRWTSATAPALLEGNRVDSPLLLRGEPRNERGVVPRGGVAILEGALGRAKSRLELARRLVRPGHPLTSRVFVNRVWSKLFGRGIVSTPDNFGVLGSEPSHPELLDALALRFAKDGWSLKRLIRVLVTSATYRTASTPRAGSAAKDPDNRLLHYHPRRRVDAEVLRDSILAISGRLDRQLGGPSIPLHREDYLRSVEHDVMKGPIDGHGRRTIYLRVRRNSLSQFLLAFDYPLPATTRGKRDVTNVPAQSLALLNHPFVHGEARRWAERLQRLDATPEALVEAMYRDAFARSPSKTESTRMLAFLTRQRSLHAGDQLSALADACHVLFASKEFTFVP